MRPGRAARLSLKATAADGRDHPQPGPVPNDQLGAEPASRDPRRPPDPARRRAGPAHHGRTAHAVQQVDLPPPAPGHAIRFAAGPQGPQVQARRHGQRCRHGRLCRGAAPLPRASRLPARRAAAGHGPGLDPHRRGGGPLDQPGLVHRRCAAHQRGRSPRTGPGRARGHGRGQGTVQHGAGGRARRSGPVLLTRPGHAGGAGGQLLAHRRSDQPAGERGDLQRARSPPSRCTWPARS